MAMIEKAHERYAPIRPVELHDPIGGQLKSLFGGLTSGPMPDRLAQLADALEEAFERGELKRKSTQ